MAFVVGPRGVVVIDSGVSFRHGQDIMAAVGLVTHRPIRLLVVTHPGQEAVFGAAAFQARGIPVWMHRDRYGALHVQNANRAYLRLERASLDN